MKKKSNKINRIAIIAYICMLQKIKNLIFFKKVADVLFFTLPVFIGSKPVPRTHLQIKGEG